MLDARKNARALANGQIKLETAPIRKWVEAASLAPPPNVVEIPLHHAVALDELEAARAASGMSTSWSSRALAQVRSWEAESGSLASALNIAKDLDKRVGVHACTQAATAYSDQHESYWHGLLGTKTGDGDDGETDEGLPYGWTANTYEVWSATLDRGTCPVCWGLDGTMVPIGKEFPGGERPGDVHPSCRCMPMTIFIPDESLKKLPGIQIDYSALKEDVKDYFRGTSLTSLLGKKHISDFLTTSLERSAPEALARKVQNRRAYMAR